MKNFIIGPAFPLRGGIAGFNEALCRTFNRLGTKSEIISFSLQYPAFLFPGKTQYAGGNPPPDISISSRINSINPLTWFSTASAIRKQNPDYVVLRYWIPFMAPCLGTIARMLRRSGIKVIAVMDNVLPHEKRAGDKILTQYFVSSCDAFVVMAAPVKDDLAAFTSSSRVSLIPHPVYDVFGEKVDKNEARKHLGLSAAGRYLLFFGFIRKYKGLDLLFEAMADPRLRALDVKLIVAGEFYEDEERYREIIRRHDLADRVILRTDFIPDEDVKYYFCAADLVTQTYHSATQSGVTQVAYHFDRPVLVTRVGGLAEMIPAGKAGYVVEKNPEEIASAIEDYFLNEREKPFAAAVREEKKRFSWESMAKGIEELAKSLAG